MSTPFLPVLPLLARRAEHRDASWTNALTAAFAGRAEVRAFEQLSEAERQATEIAIVADPDPAQLEHLPNLKWVHSLWAGVERLVGELDRPDLDIVRLSDPRMADIMAEAVLAWTLYLHRDMPIYARQQQQKIWAEADYVLPEDRRVTILGLGYLGSAAAYRLLTNGFSVRGWSRTQKSLAGIDCHSGEDGMQKVLTETDIAVILMPLTQDTRGIINAQSLAMLPAGAQLINFSRGPLIDDAALLASLDSGHLKHAVLDVFDKEPLPRDDPYWTHPGVTVLPHVSGPTTQKSSAEVVAENVQTWWETGELPGSLVDRNRGY
ncbi:glyoxylate/hydroxypyruvate reductase A [Roseibium sp. CAU 1637]|uniref:Glyoxylate/hydroxypyruvate reductase A n=1 Tax=Roseibium limicola TaxID=2816037 RepID=A0A939J9X4_9HYPH|nr:glyoxylate/hydroxypyruvate reductase A [Roseibium limicola]MBO0346836.1 glyoxylate/hydroxypyruvate reductase A [Roseibium limicola]